MEKDEILNILNSIFKDIFDDKSLIINETTSATDIEDWDSLAHLELLTAIEKKFKINFSLSEISSFENVGQVCDCILKHLG